MGIFKAYDIRGIYGEELCEKQAYMIGFYLVKYLGLSKIKVAHDLRLSHETLTKFLIQGIVDAGCCVVYLGESSTPNFYFSLFHGVNSGVMVTASHNPKEFNGFKIINEGNSLDMRNGLLDIERLIRRDEYCKSVDFEIIEDSLKSKSLIELLDEMDIEKVSFLKEYVDFLENMYNVVLNDDERAVIESVNVGVDFSSGVSSLSGLDFLSRIKLNSKVFNEIPDGNFPVHSPDPMKAKDFIEKNCSTDVFFSAAFDGDGDRIVFFDSKGDVVMQDLVIAKFVDFFSTHSKRFVVDLRVSRIVEDLAKEKGLDVKLLRVGRAFYMDYMNQNGCIFGAELSGHMFFRDFHNFDNPDIAFIYMLKFVASEIILRDEFSFSEMFDEYRKYFKEPEINLQVSNAKKVVDYLKQKYSNNISLEIDGISFDFSNYWFNVRISNTEPIVRLNIEGKDSEILKEEMKKLVDEIENI